jgi:hypothetical protein
MGSADFYPEERPVHDVSVDGFWMTTTRYVADFRRFVKATGTDARRARPTRPTTPTPTRRCSCRARWSFHERLARSTSTTHELVDVVPWRPVAPPGRPRLHGRRPRAAPGHARRLRGRRRLRDWANRSCRPNRNGSSPRAAAWTGTLRVGDEFAEGSPDGQHLAGRVSVAEPAAGPLRATFAGGNLPPERLRPVRRLPATSGNGRATTTPGPPDAVVHACCGPSGPRVNPRSVRQMPATTLGGPGERFRGWSSGGSPCARPITATATAPPPARRRRSKHRWATWAFAASSDPPWSRPSNSPERAIPRVFGRR